MTIGVVEFLLSGFTDNSGEPLALGKVYTYDAGSTTPKATYTDSNGVTPLSNPIILDANGRKKVFASGSYKFVIADANDVVLYTFDNLFFGIILDFNNVEAINVSPATLRTSAIIYAQVQDGTPPYVSSVGGSANAITLAPSPAIPAYATGQYFRFKASNTNTSAATVNISGNGAKTIKKLFGAAKYDVLAGDIAANSWNEILYDGTDFLLLNRNNIIAKTNSQTLVNNTTTDSVLFSATIKANTLGAYGKIRLTSMLQVDNATGSDQTVRIHAIINSSEISDPSAVTIPLAVSQPQVARVNVDLSGHGATNAQRGIGSVHRAVNTGGPTVQGTATVPNDYLGARYNLTEDSTADMTIAVRVQFGAANVNLGAYDMGSVLEFLG